MCNARTTKLLPMLSNAQRKYHEMFIHAGGLGVLKSWVEPYQDGTLPNVRVRQTVLNACKVCVCVFRFYG